MRIYVLKDKHSNKVFATSLRSIDCMNMPENDYQNSEQVCLDTLPDYIVEALLKLPWTFEKS